jgi:hypothetical protein
MSNCRCKKCGAALAPRQRAYCSRECRVAAAHARHYAANKDEIKERLTAKRREAAQLRGVAALALAVQKYGPALAEAYFLRTLDIDGMASSSGLSPADFRRGLRGRFPRRV